MPQYLNPSCGPSGRTITKLTTRAITGFDPGQPVTWQNSVINYCTFTLHLMTEHSAAHADAVTAQRITRLLAQELDIRPQQADAVIELLDGGATVPFIA